MHHVSLQLLAGCTEYVLSFPVVCLYFVCFSFSCAKDSLLCFCHPCYHETAVQCLWQCRGTCYESGETSLWFVILEEAVSVEVLRLAVFGLSFESWQGALQPSRIAISRGALTEWPCPGPAQKVGPGFNPAGWASRRAASATCQGPWGVVCLFHTWLMDAGKVDSCGRGQDCQPAAGSGTHPHGDAVFLFILLVWPGRISRHVCTYIYAIVLLPLDSH